MNEDGIPEDLADAVEAAFVSVIAQARASAVAAIRARSSTLVAAAGTDHVAQPDAVFNIDEWMERVNAEVGPTIEKVLIDSANQAGIGVSLDLADPRMAAAAVRHIDGIASWGQNFRQTVAKVIEEGMAKGWSVDRMADKLAETGSLTDASARRIARTEAIAAANAGTIEGWKLLGFVTGKRWLATPDEKTRDTHAAADGQEVPLDGRFTIGDGTADYPGDPALPVGERVNCRCRMLSIDDGADAANPEPQDTTVTMPARSSIRLPQPPPGTPTIDDGGWRTTTDRSVHARSLWAESPTVRRTIIDVQANLVRGRAPDHAVDFVDVVMELASDPAITIDSVSQRWWQQPETIRDHVVAAADELLGQLDDAPSVNRRLYAPVDSRWLAGTVLVGATIAMLSPSEWTDTDGGDGVVAMDPPVDAVEVVPGSYLWAGVVQVTGIDRDRSRLSVRPLDRSGALVATAAKADVYAQFANPYHDERGRFARKGEGRSVPTKGIPDKTSLAAPGRSFSPDGIGGRTTRGATIVLGGGTRTKVNLTVGTIRKRVTALTDAIAEDLGADRPDVILYTDIDSYGQGLADAAARFGGPAPGEGLPDARVVGNEIHLSPMLVRDLGEVDPDGVSMSPLAYRQVAHEMMHTISGHGTGKVEYNTGLQAVVEEGAAEILSVFWASSRFGPTLLDTKWGGTYAADGDTIVTGVEALVRRHVYSERVAEVMATAITRVGWDRQAVVGEVRRVFSGGTSDRNEFFQADDGSTSRFQDVHGDGQYEPKWDDLFDSAPADLTTVAFQPSDDPKWDEARSRAATLLLWLVGPDPLVASAGEFANPYHDELGRFARKGEGRRVPTKGIDERVDLMALDPRGATIAYEDLFPGNPIPPGESRPPQVLGPILKRPGYKGVFRDLNNRSGTSVGGEHQVYITEKGATRVSFLGTDGPQWNVFDHQEVIAEILDTSQAIDPSVKIQFGIVRGVDDWMLGGTDAAVAFDIPDRIVFPTPSKIKDKVQWTYLTKEGTPDRFMPAAKKSTWAEYVTTHEHGHAAHFRRLREDGQPIDRHKSKLTIDVRELVRAELDRRGSPLLARAHLGLSEYGMSNEYEAVAEAFAQRRLDPAKLSVGAREILDRAGLGEETQP